MDKEEAKNLDKEEAKNLDKEEAKNLIEAMVVNALDEQGGCVPVPLMRIRKEISKIIDAIELSPEEEKIND